MKPMTSAFGLSKFLLRLIVPVVLYLAIGQKLMSFNFKDANYLIDFGMALFSVLMFLGILSRKSTFTIISAILLLIFSVLFLVFEGINNLNLIVALTSIVISFFFITSGNRKVNFNRY